ncbi:hypothetical protein K458DRAFT_377920 [Lentithecium fluviatile CBS 122367]|uniref:Nephrocystin 3-like N-terminal domain-containing protein n=1 Tax=Lentithecium fluviatile CBS 122367 TaxID=1168545 RepID=A0A6G1IHC9_9PLEO|nr:hypothetical protein K458DRAFT_377920 [Lentithecium fluviatile CBS 122367]
MAEAAAAATGLQLIHFSGVVLDGCLKYISKAKAANREIERIINDISGLERILRRLHTLITDADPDQHIPLTSLGRLDGAFQYCLTVLQELQTRLTTLTNASSARRKLLWPLEEGKVIEILGKLGEQKQTFILALTGELVFASGAASRQGREVLETLKDIKAKEERSSILRWLGGPDPSTNFDTARRKHEKGAGEWLLQSEEFQSWKTSNGHLMWVSGIPGAGKTILSSTVIEYLTTQHACQTNSRLAYYFFDFNDFGKQTIQGCLKSVVQQLCAQASEVPEPLRMIYDTCKGTSPTTAQLAEILSAFNDGTPQNFIVIDALDECRQDEVENERTVFFDVLSQLKNATTGAYRIFITSRAEADISNAMKSLADVGLELKGQGVADDIRSHVVASINNDARMKKWPQSVKDEVINDLSKKANGM